MSSLLGAASSKQISTAEEEGDVVPSEPGRFGMPAPFMILEQPLKSSPQGPRPSIGRRVASLDDQDIMRMRSASSFGWYDEGTMTESEDLTTRFMQIDDWRDTDPRLGGQSFTPTGAFANTQGWQDFPTNKHSPVSSPAPANGIAFELENDLTLTTKTFNSGPGGTPVPYAVAIRAFRVISGGGGHAQYQFVLSTNVKIWKRWKRFSDFKMLAEYAKLSDLKESVARWNEITQTQRWFRCLEANYLRTKCYFLERFMAQLLFDLPSPSLLLTFVHAQEGAIQEDTLPNYQR